MKKLLFTSILGLGIALSASAVPSGYYGPGSPALVLSASTGTNSTTVTTTTFPVWPSAIGSNSVLASVIYSDPTNVTKIQTGSAKDFSFEFVGTFAGGTGGSGSTSNLVVRFAYDDQLTAPSMTTNNVASRIPTLWSWTIPVTIAAGAGSVDAVTNMTPTGLIPAPSTSHGNWYVYDITWFCSTNASPFLTNYSLYFQGK